MIFNGRARKVGDDINTDYIISSRRKRDTLNEVELSKYLMEDICPNFASRINEGDFIVAGRNFGCGSAMEIAALVIRGAKISVVVAKSFSRSFYRNGINNGLLLIETNTDCISDGDELRVVVEGGTIVFSNLTKVMDVKLPPLPEQMLDILKCGGLVNFMLTKGFN